uniref:Uncharacterized protein n=1 Tax=Pinguiococcus pyrenoidosus TaxID=172671 RepID=A0A7R9U8S4_9STRA|mmetsp:Transcript_1870/g.8311  ORF Transcript_1870/g.8311 Transcript_1870/m.8311 type:complete len:701 (+) Transcript_1870:1-2103(+)
MTSVTSTGYRSTNDGQFNPLNMVDSSSAALAKLEVTKDDEARAMEKEVNSLIEAAAENGIKGKYGAALEKAKEAHKKERALCRHREQHGLADQINLDLTFAVAFNLANCYHQNGLYDQALQTYSIIVRNHQYPQAGRLKVNMGNIHYEQREYNQAIKMYRKALDQIPQTGKELRFKIFRNIGNAFIRLGQYQDAIQSYETIMAEMPDFQTAFNLILCYFALGDADRMRRGFQRTLSIPIPGLSDDADDDDDLDDVDEAEATGQKRVDGLRLELLSRRNDAHAVILTLAKLIAPKLEEGDLYKGYDWVINELKQDHERLASQMEIEKALHHMRNKEFQAAIDVLKSFEKRGQKLKAMAAVNLCFIYFLERDYEQADHYADMAMRHDRYNAKALVNKGNCFFVQENYLRAKEMYLEAVGVEADCVEAIYNLGLANIRLGAHSEAYQAFEKLHTLLPNNPEVLYQIANFHESMGELQSAAQTLNVLVARVPSDPGLLARLGQIYTKEEDESQAFHYHLESYRHYPVNLDVISWLGVWYVKSELYEKAIHFFERASQIQPQEPKWRLMVTSCYRRMGNYQRALQLYEELHEEYPENLECLRYIVAILKDMGRPYDEYQQKLNRLDRSAPANQVPSTRTEDLRPKAASSGKPSRGPPEKSRPVEDAPMAAPTAKKVNRGGSRPASTAPEDDDFDDEDVNDLLPTW